MNNIVNLEEKLFKVNAERLSREIVRDLEFLCSQVHRYIYTDTEEVAEQTEIIIKAALQGVRSKQKTFNRITDLNNEDPENKNNLSYKKNNSGI